MPQPPPSAQTAAFIVPLVVIALVILRNSRERRVRIETLWIAPLMIVAMVGLSLAQEGLPSPMSIGVDVVALALGAFLGWWRARFTQLTIDTATHQLTSRASPIGMLVILGIFALRYMLRLYAAENSGALGLPVHVVADAALVITVGLVCAQRLEIFVRASRMLAEVRAGTAS